MTSPSSNSDISDKSSSSNSEIQFPTRQYVRILCDDRLRIHNNEVFQITWIDFDTIYISKDSVCYNQDHFSV